MRFHIKKRQLISILGILFSSLLHAQALSLIQRSQDEVIRGADLIVHGTVMKSKTHSTDQGMYTLNTVRVHTGLKGQSSHTLYIYQSGGVHKGLSQSIVGQVSLSEGEEWILFLSSLPDNDRMRKVLADNQIQAPLYRILSGPSASTQVISNAQGHKSVRLHQARKIDLSKIANHQTPSLKLVKVKPSPRIQLKVPNFKVKTKGKLGNGTKGKPKRTDLTKVHSPADKSSPTKPTQRLQPLETYIDQLKTAIDRSLAPQAPTH